MDSICACALRQAVLFKGVEHATLPLVCWPAATDVMVINRSKHRNLGSDFLCSSDLRRGLMEGPKQGGPILVARCHFRRWQDSQKIKSTPCLQSFWQRFPRHTLLTGPCTGAVAAVMGSTGHMCMHVNLKSGWQQITNNATTKAENTWLRCGFSQELVSCRTEQVLHMGRAASRALIAFMCSSSFATFLQPAAILLPSRSGKLFAARQHLCTSLDCWRVLCQ
jgi:hypothetical protein